MTLLIIHTEVRMQLINYLFLEVCTAHRSLCQTLKETPLPCHCLCRKSRHRISLAQIEHDIFGLPFDVHLLKQQRNESIKDQ